MLKEKWLLTRDLRAKKRCPESLVVKAMPLRNSKAPESEVQDLLTSATKSESAMPLVPSLAGEHEDVVDGAGVGEPVPLDSDLAQSLAEGVKGGVSDAEDMCGLEGGGDDTVEHDEVLEGAAVGEPATLLGPPLAQ